MPSTPQIAQGSDIQYPVQKRWSYTDFEGQMQLTANEEVLVEAFRRLPPATADQLAALVRRLAARAPNTATDWSDSWSDSDLQEFSAASLRSVETADTEDPV